MSTNPYAAPKAQVADHSTLQLGNFLPAGRGVPMGNGWTWMAHAWGLFRAAMGAWIGMVVVFAVIFFVLALIPLVGPIASFVLGPVFTAGFVMAARSADEGGEVQFSQLFAGFKHRFGTLAAVGGLYLVGTIVIVFAASMLTGIGMFSVLGGAATPEQAARLGLTLAIAVLLVVALMLPLVMAIWFAPPLVAFHDMGAWEAMKASFFGCLKNLLPFLLYGIVVFIAAVIASIPLFLGWLVLGPVIAASLYTSYRDIYFTAA